MKLSTWILVGLLLAGAVGGFIAWRRATEPARLRAELRELEGGDLRTLSGRAKERMEALFARYADPVAAGIENTRYDPFAVLRLAPDTPGELIYLIRTGDIGGDQAVSVWEVDAGDLDHRIWNWSGEPRLESMRAAFRPEAGVWCIEAWMSGNGKRTRHFRYRRPEGWFALLRVEDENGRAQPMPQGHRLYSAIGTAEEWASLLSTYQGSDLIYWLGWLKADHVSERKFALEQPVLRAVLGNYAMSPNPWIREAAELALRP